MTSLCLNAIVKDEGERIERMLWSVAPYISCYVIYDTGSTDDTVAKIRAFMDARGIPGTIVMGYFESFGQARNAALDAARASGFQYDYLLFCDADMEFVDESADTFRELLTGAAAYTVMQKSAGVHYANVRLLHHTSNARYVGSTHEYLDESNSVLLPGVHFVDHADGANRPGKFERDIAILLKDVEADPQNARAWFYLANSYRDSGRFSQALNAYRNRIALGGWEEEVYLSKVNSADCLQQMGFPDNDVAAALVDAYNYRPSRHEASYELAKFYRERSLPLAGLVWAQTNLSTTKNTDLLFVSNYAANEGPREEYSICAWYDPSQRSAGFSVCDDLAIDRSTSERGRWLAKANLYSYMQPLCSYDRKYTEVRLDPSLPAPFVATNPSIANIKFDLYTTIRTVNYRINDLGRYETFDPVSALLSDIAPIATENYIAKLSSTLEIEQLKPIYWTRPAALFPHVLGMEDIRLFHLDGGLAGVCCIREADASGVCFQASFRLEQFPDHYAVADLKLLSSPAEHNKNWAPLTDRSRGGLLYYAYRPGWTMVYTDIAPAVPAPHPVVASMSGSTQYIPHSQGWLTVVHEADYRDGKRYYTHRFLWIDMNHRPRRLSWPFYFKERGIEFAVGLAKDPDTGDVLISYGFNDREAWVARVTQETVNQMLRELST